MSTPVFDITKVSKPTTTIPTESKPTKPTKPVECSECKEDWENILDAYCFMLDPVSYLSSE